MSEPHSSIDEQLAQAASCFQEQRTGRRPSSVTVLRGEDTLVVTLQNALAPVEKALAQSPAGVSRVQEFHRQLFANSSDPFLQEIKRITGREVREAAAEIELGTGAVVHAFTTGAMVQVFQFAQDTSPDVSTQGDSNGRVERADDDGLRVTPDAGFQ